MQLKTFGDCKITQEKVMCQIYIFHPGSSMYEMHFTLNFKGSSDIEMQNESNNEYQRFRRQNRI